MSRTTDFENCKHKIIELETFLTKRDSLLKEKSIDATRGPDTQIHLCEFIRNRSGILNYVNKESELLVINVQEPGNNAHSVILVKNQYIPEVGWSIFDSNGTKHFPFIITDAVKNITESYLQVSGRQSLNYGSNSNNPGFCGIFGIIFMVYFYNHKTDPNWVHNWRIIYEILSKKRGNVLGPSGIDLAANVQNIIASNAVSQSMIAEINNEINTFIQNKHIAGGKPIKRKKKAKKLRSLRGSPLRKTRGLRGSPLRKTKKKIIK